jgi:hypothetical protein
VRRRRARPAGRWLVGREGGNTLAEEARALRNAATHASTTRAAARGEWHYDSSGIPMKPGTYTSSRLEVVGVAALNAATAESID